LATRVPYRGRGIAQALLAAYIDDSAERGCRSVMINADEDDWPVGLYRKIGFSDEVLFHSRYVLG
jgi:ribosomal protein S18 acetylase RimI-like enzyme